MNERIAGYIPNAEIEQDIIDTEREIAVLLQEIAALELMPYQSAEYRMAQFRASARREGVRQREEFVTKLRNLLASRAAP